MKKFLLLTFLLAAFAPAAFADNIAACELVLLEEIEDEDMQGSAQVASYRPAADFIASLYDDNPSFIEEVDDLTIRGVICVRKSVIPTSQDFPLIASGIPFSLSQNFDSTTSGLLTIYFKDGEFQHQYSGPDLTDKETQALEDIMNTYNQQPHYLGQSEPE